MKYYPVFLDIQHRNCLVVGGGSVGTRKVKTLLQCAAKVTVVSLETTAEIEKLDDEGAVRLINRQFIPSDLDGMFLVFGATDNDALNRQIHEAAEHRGVLCNIADHPEECNFILPAIVRQGELVIAISTSGTSPAFAKKLRKDLEQVFGREYAEFLQLMGAIRKKLLKEDHKPEAHKHLFERLINENLITMIKERNHGAINALLSEVLGQGYEFEILMQ